MTELTRDKFKEAEFFLDQMQDLTDDDRSFRYYLSAFVSSSRSTTWVLDREYKNSDHGEVFVEWYGDTGTDGTVPGTVQDELSSIPVCRFMGTLRNTIVKEGIPLTTKTMMTETDISPSAVEVLAEEGLPAPTVEVKTRHGESIGSFVGFGWKIRKEDDRIRVLSRKEGEWTVLLEATRPDLDISDLRCEYSFAEPQTTVNSAICDVCERYLDIIDAVIHDWEQYLWGEIDASDLDADYSPN